MPEEILYKDDGVTLTNTYIQINKYYFPLATSKLVLFDEIESVELNSTEGATHSWGTCTKYMNNWFPLDRKRSGKKKFIALRIKNKNIKPSFTPDDPDKVFQIIWENHTPQGREQVERRTAQLGKQTEIAQQQLMEREEQEKNNQETTVHELKEVKK